MTYRNNYLHLKHHLPFAVTVDGTEILNYSLVLQYTTFLPSQSFALSFLSYTCRQAASRQGVKQSGHSYDNGHPDI